jgi:hypothetical protein
LYAENYQVIATMASAIIIVLLCKNNIPALIVTSLEKKVAFISNNCRFFFVQTNLNPLNVVNFAL